MKKHGFTLIELLVVIGIIAMLIAIGIPNYLSARQRASDARKKSDMSELKNALRLYYNDYNKYPSGISSGDGAGNGFEMWGCGATGTGECPCATGSEFAAGGAGCDSLYMKKFPTGFLVSPYTIKYYQTKSGEDFCLQTALDNKSDPDITTSQSRCAGNCSSYCSLPQRYCVCAD